MKSHLFGLGKRFIPATWCLFLGLTFCVPPAQSGPTDAHPALRLGDSRLAAAMPPPVASSHIFHGRHLVLEAQRDFARPEDRWVPLVLDVTGLPGDRKSYSFTAKISAFGTAAAAESLEFTADAGRILLQVNMRYLAAPEVWVEVIAEKDGKVVDSTQCRLRAEETPNPLSPGDKISVRIDAPESTASAGSAAVVIGVPFAPGQLWDAERLSLQTSDGTPVPFQSEATGTWIEGGSIQWVQFRTVVDPEVELAVVVDAGTQPDTSKSTSPLVSKTGETQWTMQAGSKRLLIGPGASPIIAVGSPGQALAGAGGARGLYLIDSRNRLAQSSSDAEITIESAGPLSASIRIEADYVTEDGEKVARHITRLESHAGKDGVNITHTLILTQDTNKLWFREAGWELSLPESAKENARAIFALDAENLNTVWETALTRDAPAASIVQDSYPSIGGGSAVFRVLQINKDGSESMMKTGKAMGDWGGYLADAGGLIWSVKDAARQHPKEISISEDKLNLLLFSSRPGEQMDFRIEALEKRWGVTKQLDDSQLSKFREHTSNAVGWSKTHELLLLPVPAESKVEAIAAESARLRQPVYGIVDPAWIYQSRAMGPLHPYDPERFPESEALLRAIFDHYADPVPGDRYNSFYDYYAGPHYSMAGRYRLTYTLLHDAWLYAARTGDRRVRKFAEGANRAFRDNYISHWDSARKKKGLFIEAPGGTGGWRKSDFPFYWEENSSFTLATTTSLMQFIWDYQISGNRRSAEVARDFSAALLEHWTPDTKVWRGFLALRVLAQAYQFTNDPELLTLIEESANHSIYDPEGEFLMSSENRPYGSSLYKTNTDIGTMIQLWELLGTERWHEMAFRTSEYWWKKRAGLTPIFRISGDYLNFLFDQTASPAIAQTVDFNLRHANSNVDPDTGAARVPGFSSLDNIFQGIPYGMDVVARSGADRDPVASISEFDDYGNESSWFLKKGDNSRVVFHAQPPKHDPGILRSRLSVEILGAESIYGLDLVRMDQRSDGTDFDGRYAIELVIPKDSPDATYRVTPELRGSQFAVAEALIPLVFRCEGYWRPSIFRPAYRYYFNVPEGATAPKIFLEAPTLLYQPDGKIWADGKTVDGLVSLPAESAGLWSLQPVETGLIKAVNIPPYFAMNSAESWFNPEESTGMTITKNAGADEGREPQIKGILVGNKKGLQIAGKKKKEPLFANDAGTIEFFMRPDWGTFDIRDGTNSVAKPIFRVQTGATPWGLSCRLDPRGTNINMGPREPSHSFYAEMETSSPSTPRTHQLRAWHTRQIVEADKWVHVALVWGPQDKLGARGRYEVPSLAIYINGKGSQVELGTGQTENLPVGPVKSLSFPPELNASISQLRISSTKRYDGDFDPPSPGETLAADPATTILLPLNGDLKVAAGKNVEVTR